MPKAETRGEVFEELLRFWRLVMEGMNREFSSTEDRANADLERQVDEWRKRYRDASND